jgi:hypothetical protein
MLPLTLATPGAMLAARLSPQLVISALPGLIAARGFFRRRLSREALGIDLPLLLEAVGGPRTAGMQGRR